MQKVLSTPIKVLCLAAGLSAAAQAANQDSDLLVYRVWEPGLEPYISRFLVTPRYVRIDEGGDDAGYTLFDRREHIIYNISHADRSVLVMNPPSQVPKQPDDLKLDERIEDDPKAPRIAGKAPQHISLLANGQVCRELVVVPGLMPEAMAALRDFQQVLARVQAATLSAMPSDMQTPCDLADNVYAPLRPLAHGLPIQEHSPTRSRSLVDFENSYQADDKLFGIPADYERSPMPGL